MALPTPERTWIQSKSTYAGSASKTTEYKTMMLKIKQFLISVPGVTVIASSNGVSHANYAMDYWTTIADLIQGGAGAAHSWILYSFLGRYLLQAYDNSWGPGWEEYGSFYCSDTAYAGGIYTANPTQARQVTLNVNQSGALFMCGRSDTTRQFQIHGLYEATGGSSLGLRLFINTSSSCGFVLIWDTMADVRGADAAFIGMQGYGTSSAGYANWKDLNTSTAVSVDNTKGTAMGRAYLTCESYGSSTTGAIGQQQTAVDAKDAGWPMNNVGIYVSTLEHIGRRGRIPDLYWGSTQTQNGDLYPGDGSATWVQYGNLVVPNDGTACPVA